VVPLFPAEQKQPAVLAVGEKWRGREQSEALLLLRQRSTACPYCSQALLLCTKATSHPLGSDVRHLRASYGVSSGPLLPQFSVVSNITAFSKTSARGVAMTM